jgi:hypothetical protein
MVVLMRCDPGFDLPHSFQRPVPPAFQFISDQTILGIGGIELPLRALSGITRRFKISPQCLQDFVLTTSLLLAGLYRGLYGRWLHRTKTSLPIASSTGIPPKAIHRASPLSSHPRWHA